MLHENIYFKSSGQAARGQLHIDTCSRLAVILSVKMVSALPKITLIAGLLAMIYQAVFKNLLWTILGLDKTVDPLESFGVRCEKIKEPGLEACEDMWLHEPSGLLYMACSDSLSKVQWNPSYD